MTEQITYKDRPNSTEELEKVLHPLVKKWFYQTFREFSLPQLHGVLEIHSRKNILISAPTGSTKTLTAFLSILNELVDHAVNGTLEDKVYCAYVSPLRALNRDIEKNLAEPLAEIEKLAGRRLGIRVAVRTGDTTAYEKSKMTKLPPHILITTPESLAIVLSSIRFKEHLRHVDWLIIDEIHALAENKRGTHLSLSVERLAALSSHLCRVGLSATIAPLGDVAQFLAGARQPCIVVRLEFLKKMDLRVLSPVPDLINTTHEKMQTRLYELIDSIVQQHKTALIFTNTRAATERVVDHLKHHFPQKYSENIGAHHGSLSKETRHSIENRLREGKLKVIVCSTSLELGIDIGFIDVVILLGSPKSVARALQRIGRSGHRLHDTTKGRIIVMDRDDLVECSVLLKAALEKKIDRVHIPRNALDVLAQHIYGMAIAEKMHIDEMFSLVRKSYCYEHLPRKDFNQVVAYLAGEHVSLEERSIYAKIWYDRETGMVGKRGKSARMLYMTNLGTIPEEAKVIVKLGPQVIGTIDEAFLERLRKGDIFVLGGEGYVFSHAKGMVACVQTSSGRPPTIPSWYSEMLPLSFDLAKEIGRFRRLMNEHFVAGESKQAILAFIQEHLYVDENSAKALYAYFYQQYHIAEIPSDEKIVIEQYRDSRQRYLIFHTLFGRRVNEALSRAIAYIISRLENHDVDIGVNDNGFFLASQKKFSIEKALRVLRASKLRTVLSLALERTEILARRFRHCAVRALMILRKYKGKEKRVGRQQVSSMILMSAVRRIDPDFCILKEARREVFEDLMEVGNAEQVVKDIEDRKIRVDIIESAVPSPFAFMLVMQGYTDLMKMQDRIEFLKNMHQLVLAKLSLRPGLGGELRDMVEEAGQ